MNNYKRINNVLGWLVFVIASMVYILTSEPTASFWDCGEYIATAFKLQVGHPPGAPFFQMLGRFFTLFAFNDLTQVARMINTMSALASGATIMFLFWSITALAKKIAIKSNEQNLGRTIAVMGSGLVGALAYTFSDSFWFSAVEGEVYAMSSFFTAVTFWAILKWEGVADEKHNIRWIIFIAFLIGISIGVHLLNLLAIPAVVFVFYFKKKKASRKGVILTFLISVVLLYLILYFIIPIVLKLAGWFELFFVNSVGLPFNSGTIIYFLLLFGFIALGLYYTQKKAKLVANTIILCFTFLLIGYSSFLLLIIRSNADVPIDENNPEDAVSLLAYLNREQYGYTPLFYGPYYNAPLDREKPYDSGTPIYKRDKASGKYVILDPNEQDGMRPNYDKNFCTFFPRMHSNRAPRGGYEAYSDWVNIKGKTITTTNNQGKRITEKVPTFGENLKFFFRYQLGHMYFRYFMWNFSGRQNDIQPNGSGDYLNGNWITGIPGIDNKIIGSTDIPEHMKSKANNKYYLLPLLLGLIGLYFHARQNAKDAFVVGLLFFFTGIAIVLYLNQAPNEPRERDYAYAASFYAFAIWIGIGVLALWNYLKNKLSEKTSAIAVSVVCMVAVPTLMANQNWNDHDRSGRYTALAMANNYLNSCPPNAILFTYGDNDTFPLWYAQEVEGIRTDVKVVNLSLAASSWYIEAMARKSYNAEPIPHTISIEKYETPDYNYLYMFENPNSKEFVDLKRIIEFVQSDDPITKNTKFGTFTHIPSKNLSLKIDSAKVRSSNLVPLNRKDSVLTEINWRLNRGGLMRNNVMVLDILASNNWQRPICFATTAGKSNYIGLENYFALEGFAYRLVPYKTISIDGQIGEVNTDIMYDNVMNKFQYGFADHPDIYIDETNLRNANNLKNNFARLANALIIEGKNDSAIAVCDKCEKEIPDNIVSYNRYNIPIAESYYRAGAIEKGNKIFSRLFDIAEADINFCEGFPIDKYHAVAGKKQEALIILNRIAVTAKQFKQEELQKKAESLFMKFYRPNNQQN